MAGAKLALTVAVLLSALLSLAISPASPSLADTGAARWLPVSMPQDGEAGRWVLAEGSDVRNLTRAADGTLYCYANPTGTDYTLFKSTDKGFGWSRVGKVKDSIVDIAVALDDARIIAYATVSRVYLSTDGGETFTLLQPGPGGAGSANVEIMSIALGRRDGISFIAAGTRDADAAQYGGVYVLDESRSPLWADTGLGSYDVYAVAFSPDFAADGQLVVVATDEVNTFVTARVGENTWGSFTGTVRLNKGNFTVPVPVAVDTSADIAFPDGYSALSEDSVLYVGIDAGAEQGDVYRIRRALAPESSIATDLNIGSQHGASNVDITSLVVSGSGDSARLMAGAAGSTRVYLSKDSGGTWTVSSKPPTGASATFVVMDAGSGGASRAYAATSGAGSAFSYTADGGNTWNQSGLIDTRIDSIVDLAVSPDYGKDSTIFMLTFGVKHSLWRSRDGGVAWERVFAGFLPNVDSIDRIAVSPQFGSSRVLFVAGQSNGSPAMWRSADGGQSLGSPRSPRDPASGAAVSIDVWALAGDNSLFTGSFNGSNGLVYRTDSAGLFYSARAAAGTNPLSSIALSPVYAQDRTVLAGNSTGKVYWSQDGGESFTQMGTQLPDLIAGGSTSHTVSVAFDPEYSRNRTVYAASHCKKGATNASAIYRFITGKSTTWESIGTMPAGAIIDRLEVSGAGVLYAVDSRANGGIQRSLDPTYSLGPAFAVAGSGLDTGSTLFGIWLRDNKMWSVDTTGKKLMVFADTLATPPLAISPADKASGVDISDARLEWESLPGATTYEWQLDYDTNFTSIPAGFEGTSKSISVRLPALQYATRYYWRARAAEPVPSPWLEKRSFVTRLGSTVLAPGPLIPEAGATATSPKPVFQWSAIAGATRYELLVSAEDSFARPVIVKAGEYALPATAWQCDVSLDFDTTYYWKVRAVGSDSSSAWSAVSAFTTGSPAKTVEQQPKPPAPEPMLTLRPLPAPVPSPALPPSPPPPVQPSPVPTPPSQPQSQSATPEWAAWLMRMGVVFLFTMLAILVAMIVLIVRLGKLRGRP